MRFQPSFRALCLVVLGVAAAANRAMASPPEAQAAAFFASGLNGPEGLAFGADGSLYVGAVDGEIRRYRPDGTFSVLANVGDRLAGVSVGRNGEVLACAFGAGRVWSIDPATGAATVAVAGILGPNFVLDTRRGRRYVAASLAGSIVEVSTGTPLAVASGLSFPNGLAQRGDRHLYVAESIAGRVSRLPILSDGTLGPASVYATGLPFADGIAFDRRGNLLVTASDQVWVVVRRTGEVRVLSADPLFDWPANLAFGRGRGVDGRSVFLTNFGASFGNGTTLVRFRYSNKGARIIY